MGGCTAVNCSNTRSKGFRLFRFPRDSKRRTIWLQNCCRDKWQPTNSSELCEIHFEEGQFEQHRQDGLKKLKPNAIPTLFDIPNPPHLLESKRKSLYEVIESKDSNLAHYHSILLEEKQEMFLLQQENNNLKRRLQVNNNQCYNITENHFSKLLKEKNKLLLLQKEKKLLETKLQKVHETLDEIMYN